ncbi:uncharacterized protein KZ484_019736 [Pholidichthys leucotaenia]
MGNPHGLSIVAGPESLRLEGGRQGRPRGADRMCGHTELQPAKGVQQNGQLRYLLHNLASLAAVVWAGSFNVGCCHLCGASPGLVVRSPAPSSPSSPSSLQAASLHPARHSTQLHAFPTPCQLHPAGLSVSAGFLCRVLCSPPYSLRVA